LLWVEYSIFHSFQNLIKLASCGGKGFEKFNGFPSSAPMNTVDPEALQNSALPKPMYLRTCPQTTRRLVPQTVCHKHADKHRRAQTIFTWPDRTKIFTKRSLQWKQTWLRGKDERCGRPGRQSRRGLKTNVLQRKNNFRRSTNDKLSSQMERNSINYSDRLNSQYLLRASTGPLWLPYQSAKTRPCPAGLDEITISESSRILSLSLSYFFLEGGGGGAP